MVDYPIKISYKETRILYADYANTLGCSFEHHGNPDSKRPREGGSE